MYSSIQQQCLEQLGIPLYQLKEGHAVAASEQPSSLSWSVVADCFVKDVKSLFPNAVLSEHGLALSDNFVWLLNETNDIKLSEQTLLTPLPSLLSVEQKKALWLILSEHRDNK